MKFVVVVAVLAALMCACTAQQTICSKYFGNDGSYQTGNMTAVIGQVFGALLGDKYTAPYFNGKNPGSINFTNPQNANALATLASHLVQFFGAAIGCNAPGFPSYSGNPNMMLVHTFQKSVDKAAYEHFNQQVINVLRQDGVVQDDLFAIAQVLDQFRTGNGNSANQICQSSDCTTSPYTVEVGATTAGSTQTFFNPPFYTVPSGNQVEWVLTNSAHTVTQAEGTSVSNRCSQEKKGFDFKLSKAGATAKQTFKEKEGTQVPYYCMYHCSEPSGETMYAQVNVVAATTSDF
jgi:plastocyanin